MSDTLILHQYEISPFCDKIRRVLHYKQLAYDVREWPLIATKEVKVRNAVGKLPCLEHNGTYIPDSTNIAHYLEEVFPARPLLPSGARERGLVHVLEDWADESLYFYEMYLRFVLPHNAQRVLPRMTHVDPGWFKWLGQRVIPKGIRKILNTQGVGRKSHEEILRDVERHIQAVSDMLSSSSWLVGEALTLADISVFAMLSCFHDADEGKAIIQRFPAVVAWMQRVDAATAPA